MDTILVVDDEKNYQLVLSALLTAEGYEVVTASSGQEALDIIATSDLNLIITDMKMPELSGMELLNWAKESHPDIPVVMMTAYGTVGKAVEAMKLGAFDYITKPFSNEELKATIKKALDMHSLLRQNRLLARELESKHRFRSLVAQHPKMKEIFRLVERVAPTRSTVLITGESGTGKELIAKSVHFLSPRQGKPFISVNCSALPESLLESELFGHEKGAFTGAMAMRKGRFELADTGTLFLDEVGEMSPSLQVKLLRVLQEMEFERVGSPKTIKVDVRVLAASNRDLKQEMEEGRFREDLFYRLNVVNVHLPPLRERKDDIPLLINHFLVKITRSMDREKMTVGQDALKVMMGYHWPGNVRELEHAIERAVILSPDDTIDRQDLPDEISSPKESPAPPARGMPPSKSALLHPRQLKALNFMRENGYITNQLYQEINSISKRHALRDLSHLLNLGFIERTGKGPSTRYFIKGSP